MKLQDKIEILWRQREGLKNKSYFFVDDLTTHDYKIKQSLKPEIEKAKREGKRWLFRDGQLFIDGQPFILKSDGKPDEAQPSTSPKHRLKPDSAPTPARYGKRPNRTVQRPLVQHQQDRRPPRYHMSHRNPWEHPGQPATPLQYHQNTQQVSQAPVSEHFPSLPYHQTGNASAPGYSPQVRLQIDPEIHQHPTSPYPPCTQSPPQGVVERQLAEQWPPLQHSVEGGQPSPQNCVNLSVHAPDFHPTYASTPPAVQSTSPAMRPSNNSSGNGTPHPTQPYRDNPPAEPPVRATPHTGQPSYDNIPAQHHSTQPSFVNRPVDMPPPSRRPTQA